VTRHESRVASEDVGRFERDESRGRVPASLGAATEGLRETVEEKLYEIVEAAEARAHEIEDQALERALDLEQETERAARQRFESSSARARALHEAIDAFELEIAAAVSSLRTRGEALASELERMLAPDATEKIAPIPEAEPEAEANAEISASPERPVSPGADDPREALRRRILDLFLAGKPRSDAQRLLDDVEDGGRYAELLDEIYEPRSETQQGSHPRRGGRRRRRPGS
jgi:hypothetical protein